MPNVIPRSSSIYFLVFSLIAAIELCLSRGIQEQDKTNRTFKIQFINIQLKILTLTDRLTTNQLTTNN